VIQLFVGLGNPGAEYQDTRHNAGFWWLDALASQQKLNWNLDRSCKGLIARGVHGGQAFWLLKPQTFMNLSGQSVQGLASFFKISPGNILVIHDELDILPGLSKLKFSGGHAGHNGLRDIHEKLGTSDYWRLRIGIGHPGHRSEVSNWVLGKPNIEHSDAIRASILNSLNLSPLLLEGNFEGAKKVLSASVPPIS
jgi:PTH1 family peptidyl-tRNA hydrolase